MAIAEKLQNIVNEKQAQIIMTNYGLPSGSKITASTKFIDYPKYIFNAFLEALRTPDTLFTNLPKKSGSGSVISLNDTANAPMRIELGSSELTQAGTPTPDSPQDIHTISGSNKVVVCGKNLAYTGWAEDFVSRINDSTKAKLEVVDGKNCLFYTASAGYQEYDTKYMFKTNWKENTQYTFRLNVKPSSANVFNLTIAYTDGTSQRIDATTSANTWSTYTKFPSYANKTIKYLRVNWSTGNDYIDLDTFMVYEGIEELEYEPYTSQEADIDLGYENLALTDSPYNPDANYSSSGGGTTVIQYSEENDGYYTTNHRQRELIVKEGTYTLSMDIKLRATGTYAILVSYVDSTGTNSPVNQGTFASMSNITASYQRFTKTYNIPSGYDKIRLTFYSTIYWKDIMLNYGSTALPFTPYGKAIEYCKIGNYEDKFIRTSGKNLIPFINQDFTLNNVHYFVQDGSLYLNGTSSGETLPTNSNFKTNLKFKLEAGTYTFSRVETAIPCYIYKYSDDTRLLLLSGTSLSGTFTLNETTDVYLSFYVYQNTLSNLFSGIMISKDGGEYEPYGNGTWYIKKNIYRKVFDGTETLDLRNSSESRTVLDYNTNTSLEPYTNAVIAPNMLSTHFKAVSQGATWVNGDISRRTQTNSIIVITLGTGYTAETALQWLVENNVEIYTPLGTPKYTQITGTLANQLENVYQKMMSQNGQTNISQVNNDLAFNISASAIEELV